MIAGLLISVATFVSPVKHIAPTPIPINVINITPTTTPTIIIQQSITPFPTEVVINGPSQRALTVATYIYGHSTEEQKEDLRNKHGVKKSTYEQEITDHAYWFDNNPNVMAMDESIMQRITSNVGSVSQQIQKTTSHCSPDGVGGQYCYSNTGAQTQHCTPDGVGGMYCQ